MITVRRATYRNRSGYFIIGSREHRGTKIFTDTRWSAERMRARVLAGQQTRLQDFTPTDECPHCSAPQYFCTKERAGHAICAVTGRSLENIPAFVE